MKSKLLIMLATMALTAALGGCAPTNRTNAQVTYIGEDAAKTIALSDAQMDTTVAEADVKLSQKDDIMYYEVNVSQGENSYRYAVDAVTGSIIESTRPAAEPTPSPAPTPVPAPAPSNAPAPSTAPQPKTNGAGQIGEAEAKRIALQDAGVQESDATYLRVKLDIDDGITVYDVEFFVAQTGNEYDYEIDAATGTIRSKDFEAESYTPPQSGAATTGDVKSEEEIRNIALAKVPGAAASDMYMKLDRDDGKLSYEGKIVYQGTEYEFEIDAYSGAIREWSSESVFD